MKSASFFGTLWIQRETHLVNTGIGGAISPLPSTSSWPGALFLIFPVAVFALQNGECALAKHGTEHIRSFRLVEGGVRGVIFQICSIQGAGD
jgi:hypothetical protein